MSRQDKLVELAEAAVELIKEVIGSRSDENALVDVTANEEGNTIIFKLSTDKTVEYSLSEIGYIFKDDLEGFEIFSTNYYREIYNKLKHIQLDTELL